MSNKAKQKGYRLEHFLEKFFKENGIGVRRRGWGYQEDLWFDDFQWRGECKNRKDLKRIYDWIENNDILFLKWSSRKIKNKPILAVIGLELFLKILKELKSNLDNSQKTLL